MRAQKIRATFIFMKGGLVPILSQLANNKRKNNKFALIQDEIENTHKGQKNKMQTEKKVSDKKAY